MPSTNSITSTRRRVCSQTIVGILISGRCARRAPIASALRPSFSKSSSRGICAPSSSMIGRRSRSRSSQPTARKSARRFARSPRTCPAISGYCTFTATRRPSWRRPTWTCASDAAAMGRGESSAKIVSIGAPSSSSSVRFTIAKGRAGTLSWRRERISTYSGGATSARAPTNWHPFRMSPPSSSARRWI
jgi:hypothetical protein